MKKTWTFVAITLILFAADAVAQCAGRTVYFQLPYDWDKTRIYYQWDSNQSLNLTQSNDGEWLVATFPANMNNDQGNHNFSFANTGGDGGTKNWIGPNDFNRSGNAGVAGNFQCNTHLGPTGELYIMEDPRNPGKTYWSTTKPKINYFYFLPPRDNEWKKKTPHIAFPMLNRVEPMELDFNRCGWYRKVYFLEEPPNEPVLIYLGPTNRFDQIGFGGLDDDPADWEGGAPPPFNIYERFQTLNSDKIFFIPDSGAIGWRTSDIGIPYQSDRCNYQMAAIIYDTHETLIAAFADRTSEANTGIRRGIVMPTLVKNAAGVPKMQFSTGKNGWDATSFQEAFNCTRGKNAMVCYDMPFARDNMGLWTFDSEKLCLDGTQNNDCSNSGGSSHGFFPDRLNGIPGFARRGIDDVPPLNENCSYATCPSCANRVQAETGARLTSDLYCHDRGLRGSRPNCGTPYGEGDFSNGDNPAVWDWGSASFERPSMLSLHGSQDRNEYFCFETHATFTYEKGQEFFFRGDDDIWVFINNNLVIDLGGAHMAAPGYVHLDSIGVAGSRWSGGSRLVEGNEYPLDIFFCDRRRTMSNARISTNMYISQENGLFVKQGDGTNVPAEVCLKQSKGGTCESLLGGNMGESELCGARVGHMLEFHVVNRKGDESYPLDANQEYCISEGAELICFGGIRVNTVNGTVRVEVSKISGLVGTQIIKAEVKDSYAASMNPAPDPVEVARFSVKTAVQMVWGSVRHTIQGANITNVCRKTNEAVTGRLVPICIAGGTWSDNSNKHTFIIDPEASAGVQFMLAQAGLRNNEAKVELEIYLDASGERKVNRLDTMFTIPANGLLILWVKGGYLQIPDTYTYTINVQGSKEEHVELKTYLPRLRWVNSDNPSIAIPDGENKGSMRNENGRIAPVWIGEKINRSLVAYDPSDGKICDVCNFDLRAEAFAWKDGDENDRLPETDDNLMTFGGLRSPRGIVNGVAHIDFSGKIKVIGNDYARVKIRGLSNSETPGTFIFWDSLQFKEPPIPYPSKVELYDSNGDGIGDSLVIVYSRGFDKDSLPSELEVFWGTDTLRFGIGDSVPVKNDRYEFHPPSSTTANLEFWEPYIKKAAGSKDIRDRNAAADKEAGFGVIDTIVIAGRDFSEVIRTRGEGSIVNWATFEDEDVDGNPLTIHLPATMGIKEKMPAIIISARYLAGDESGCGSSSRLPCSDRITLEFSEPVVSVEGKNTEDYKNPFAYMLRNRGKTEFEPLESRYLPKYMKWRIGGKNIIPAEEGDSIVSLTFENYRDPSGDTTNTPIAGDSVKFSAAKPFLADLEGNTANPREIGRQIEGRNRFTVDKIAIGIANLGNETLIESIRSIFDSLGISAEAEALFAKSRPIEILPVPDGWAARNVGERYGGTVGLMFKPDISNTIDELESSWGISIPDSAITFHVRSFYHTNLGAFVVNRELPVVRCDDAIFPPGPEGKPSCRASKSGIYVAWNLKDSKGRWAGTGAYVGLHDFRWEVNYGNIGESFDKVERQVEMFGVRRVKSRK